MRLQQSERSKAHFIYNNLFSYSMEAPSQVEGGVQRQTRQHMSQNRKHVTSTLSGRSSVFLSTLCRHRPGDERNGCCFARQAMTHHIPSSQAFQAANIPGIVACFIQEIPSSHLSHPSRYPPNGTRISLTPRQLDTYDIRSHSRPAKPTKPGIYIQHWQSCRVQDCAFFRGFYQGTTTSSLGLSR